MKKTIRFSTKRGWRLWTVDINFESKDNKDVLSITWQTADCAWQCKEDIAKRIKKYGNKKHKELWKEIEYLWDNYHLNDMHPWTKRQEQWLKDNWIENWASDFDKVSSLLWKAWLQLDNQIEDYPELKGSLWYKFGSKRLYRPIPFEDKVRIIKLFWVDYDFK